MPTFMREPRIIHETQDFLALDKPAGLIVHRPRIRKQEDPPEGSLVDWLLARYPEIRAVGDDPAERPGIVHRLDKETSGVMLVARTQPFFEYLKSQFQTRAVRKEYLAVVHGWPKEKSGTIDKPIGIKDGSVKRSIHSSKMSKEAVTDFEVMKEFQKEEDKFSLLKVSPKTGRTHQIRVHLASLGHPIAGDRLYGRRGTRFERMMLHAWSLEFPVRSGEKLRVEAEIPPEFKDAGAALDLSTA